MNNNKLSQKGISIQENNNELTIIQSSPFMTKSNANIFFYFTLAWFVFGIFQIIRYMFFDETDVDQSFSLIILFTLLGLLMFLIASYLFVCKKILNCTKEGIKLEIKPFSFSKQETILIDRIKEISAKKLVYRDASVYYNFYCIDKNSKKYILISWIKALDDVKYLEKKLAKYYKINNTNSEE